MLLDVHLVQSAVLPAASQGLSAGVHIPFILMAVIMVSVVALASLLTERVIADAGFYKSLFLTPACAIALPSRRRAISDASVSYKATFDADSDVPSVSAHEDVPSCRAAAESSAVPSAATLQHALVSAAPKTTAPRILGIASAFPKQTYTNEELAEHLLTKHFRMELPPADIQFVRHIFQRTRIEQCHVSLAPEKVFARLSFSEYSQHVLDALHYLALNSANTAIQQMEQEHGIMRDEITHLVFGTMTAMIMAPSMDVRLVLALKLNPAVQRLNVDGMGCLSGFRLVGLCKDLALAKPTNRVLLIVCDIRSALGNMLPHHEAGKPLNRSNVIVSSLFRDGGGAAIFAQMATPLSSSSSPSVASSSSSASNPIPRALSAAAPAALEVIDHGSYLVPNSIDHAWLKMDDDASQELFLSKDLPICVRENLPTILFPMLEKHGVKIKECVLAVHTGGPRVLDAVSTALHLIPEQIAASWHVMIHRGNLSGSSNLIVTEHVLRHVNGSLTEAVSIPSVDNIEPPTTTTVVPSPALYSKYTHVVGVSFGPGVGVEIALFSIVRQPRS